MSSLSSYIEMILDDEYPDFRNIIGKIPPPPRNEVREKTVLTDDDAQELLDLLVNTETPIDAIDIEAYVHEEINRTLIDAQLINVFKIDEDKITIG